MDVENISNALFTVYLQQSGLLQVESIQEGRKSKGELYLLAGQPTYAHVGNVSGQEALAHMLTWRPVHLSFRADAPRPPANLSPQLHLPLRASTLQPSPHDSTLEPAVAEKPRPVEKHCCIARTPGSEQYALSLPLTHPQRQVYCLIDGQRMVADLSRCSGKTPYEIETILHELRQRGLITLFPLKETIDSQERMEQELADSAFLHENVSFI